MPYIIIYDAKRKGYILQISSWTTKLKAKRVAKRTENFSGLRPFTRARQIPTAGLRYRVYIDVLKTKEDADL